MHVNSQQSLEDTAFLCMPLVFTMPIQKQVNSKVNDPYAHSAHYPCCLFCCLSCHPGICRKVQRALLTFSRPITSTPLSAKHQNGLCGNRWQSWSAPGSLDTENGNIPGFGLSATSMSDWALGNDYLQFDFNYSNGNTDYVGSYINSNAGYGSLKSSSTAHIYNYSARYGKGFSMSKQTMLTPYVELGHHRWERGLSATQDETYSHNYGGLVCCCRLHRPASWS
jgi:hypothetical protein